jgi:hypothetical protein
VMQTVSTTLRMEIVPVGTFGDWVIWDYHVLKYSELSSFPFSLSFWVDWRTRGLEFESWIAQVNKK